MKCICGYGNEAEYPRTESIEPFKAIQFNSRHDTEIEGILDLITLYICPKCGTVKADK